MRVYMNIQGKLTFLRAIELSDSKLLLNIVNDPDTEFMLGGWSFPISSIRQNEWIQNLDNMHETLRCMIVDKKTGSTVGVIMLTKIDYKNGNAEIHIKLGSEYRGKGYGSDAMTALIEYAFNELRLHLIYGQINIKNITSLKMFEKCGFIYEGTIKHRLYKKGSYYDMKIFSIINDK